MEERKLDVRTCLKHLHQIGWSELIDSRWREDVVKDLKEHFNGISNELIEEVLEVVLC